MRKLFYYRAKKLRIFSARSQTKGVYLVELISLWCALCVGESSFSKAMTLKQAFFGRQSIVVYAYQLFYAERLPQKKPVLNPCACAQQFVFSDGMKLTQ